jgi:hypothetical protein
MVNSFTNQINFSESKTRINTFVFVAVLFRWLDFSANQFYGEVIDVFTSYNGGTGSILVR